MTELQAIAVALAVASYGTFAWGAYGIFVPRGRPGRRLTVLKIGAVASALLIVAALLSPGAVAGMRGFLGIGMYAASLALFWWSVRVVRGAPLSLAFCEDTPIRLLRTGPYRLLRHPFYTAYLSSYLAGAVSTANPWLLLVVFGMGWIYLDAARQEERKFSGSPLAGDYEKYRNEVGMFVPRISGLLRRHDTAAHQRPNDR